MIDGYTLDYESVTWANGEVDRWTDPDEVRVHNIGPDIWEPDKRYVLRQYGEFVRTLNRSLMEAYQLLAHENIFIHSGAPQGFPMDSLSPERYGWQSWLDYAASLEPQSEPMLVTVGEHVL